MTYLRGTAHPDHLIGHNPLGAGSVFAMLLVLLRAGGHRPGRATTRSPSPAR